MITEDIIRVTVISIGYLIIFVSFLPFVKSKYWFIRIFDYPRSQKFWINLLLLLLFLFVGDFARTHDVILLTALVVNQLYLLSLIWPYIPIAYKQMKKNLPANNNSVKLFIGNVYQDNAEFGRCISAINRCNPDIIMLVETDEHWCKALDGLKSQYAYTISKPQDNTYGILLFSKLEIVKHKVRFLVDDKIPSIVADVKTSAGIVFRLYGLHPKPPVPQEAEESTERDAEILMIGKEAKNCKLPVIVAGDLNDVAWSYTTKLFLKISGLLDPRRGRGFFSSFHAKYWFLRWPLDHVFCSSHFLLDKLERLPSIGSDHFPIFIQVALQPAEAKENKEGEKHADKNDVKVANEVIEEAK